MQGLQYTHEYIKTPIDVCLICQPTNVANFTFNFQALNFTLLTHYSKKPKCRKHLVNVNKCTKQRGKW